MSTPEGTPAPLLRRLAAFVYEGVLLFGVLMVGGLVYSSSTQQTHALEGRMGLQLFVLSMLGLYFVWFWTHGGQTLAMNTWKMRLATNAGAPLSVGRALCRYLLSWMWFVPGLGAAALLGLHKSSAIYGVLLAWIASYALLSRFQPRRQFLHDVWCGTQLVDCRPSD
jgi:uncharacterized RDD family membrane protein YckC